MFERYGEGEGEGKEYASTVFGRAGKWQIFRIGKKVLLIRLTCDLKGNVSNDLITSTVGWEREIRDLQLTKISAFTLMIHGGYWPQVSSHLKVFCFMLYCSPLLDKHVHVTM